MTDGVRWLLYGLVSGSVTLIDELTLSPSSIDSRAFRWWLGALLATEQGVLPTSENIEARLGAGSTSFRLQRDILLNVWRSGSSNTTVQLKRSLWAKLLSSAFGSQFRDTDELFVEHTYLVLLANAIAHGVIGFDLRLAAITPGPMLSGQRFEEAGIAGVGEAGFFDWPLDVAGGNELVAAIIKSAAAFDWSTVDHDVLKALYQSVISPAVRHSMGEYYTPDWLAERMVQAVVDDPLQQRVLDPSCGSGTFLFHSIRHYLDAADAAGIPTGTAIANVTERVFGVDLHPVAVSLAEVTYLLAIGTERLPKRKGRLSIPVYIGDSIRWESAADSVLSAAGDVTIHTTDGHELFSSELRFPASVVSNPRFDEVVTLMSARASTRPRGGPRPAIEGGLRNLGVADDDLPQLQGTFQTLCDLHDQNRNHIWGFYIRNQARPAWLSQPGNRVERIVGNPPWLAFRHMPAEMKAKFRAFAEPRHLWAGGAQGRTTQQDLAGLFVARSVEQFLVGGGRFGFVMPRASLSRQTYGGFRQGDWSHDHGLNVVDFDKSWDLLDVRPQPFPVPGAVVFGRRLAAADLEVLHKRHTGPKSLPTAAVAFRGRIGALSESDHEIEQLETDAQRSAYARRFRQGAILVPRMLAMVTERSAGPLGTPTGSVAVVSRKSTLDKRPWSAVPALEGTIETPFVRPTYLGESIGPFRVLSLSQSVIPYDGHELMDGTSSRIDRYPGLAQWWRRAEQTWLDHRSSDKRTLLEQLDYIRQLSAQFPIARTRVVYTKAGNTLAAAMIEDERAVIDHKLYWGAMTTRVEGQYLCAILNAPAYTEMVAPFQSQGAFGARDFDKYVWMPPVPTFDPSDRTHKALVELCKKAEYVAAQVALTGRGFQRDRQVIRQALTQSGVSERLDKLVRRLLS